MKPLYLASALHGADCALTMNVLTYLNDISIELNPTARFMMNHLGIFWGLVIHSILSILVVVWYYHWINRKLTIPKVKKIWYRNYWLIVNVIFFAVVIWNTIGYVQTL